MTAPLIAINALFHGEDPMLRLRERYVEAVRRAGGLPVALASHHGDPDSRDAEIASILDRVDGLVLTGGDDFHAGPLGLGATHPSAEATFLPKQEFDLALTRAAVARDLPVLGICFGMQCLGLVGGATLIQDIPSAAPNAREHRNSAVHDVQPQKGTKLAEILGIGPVPVVSRHHQALRSVPPPWIVSAMDDENLVEAIEHPGRRFALGVQWHPEIHVPGQDQQPSDALLAALVDASRR